jgi:hypothetical protein
MSQMDTLLDKGKQALGWVDERFPLTSLYKAHLSEYYAPKNFNFWYFFGSLALLVLVNQIVTGIFLVMHYKPDAALNAAGVPVAFASVEYIMRDVPGGWIIRYLHSTGASAFFIVVYLHMFRGLLYGSYRKPRELVWLFGIAIFLCLMGEAFFGYLLPWGQMSGWGAQVIVNLFVDRCEALGRHLHGTFRDDLLPAAVAGPFAGEVDPLSRPDLQVRSGDLHRCLPDPRISRRAGSYADGNPGVADLYGHLLPVLCGNAFLHRNRQDQARTRARDRTLKA